MDSKQFNYGSERSLAQSDLYINFLSIFTLSIHHFSHHHEHPAH